MVARYARRGDPGLLGGCGGSQCGPHIEWWQSRHHAPLNVVAPELLVPLVVPQGTPSWATPYGELGPASWQTTIDWEPDADGVLVPNPGDVWPGELTPRVRIVGMFIYRFDGHIYAQAIHDDFSGPPYDEAHTTRVLVWITNPAKFLRTIPWAVDQGWGDGLAALLQVAPGVAEAVPVRRAAYLREAARLDRIEQERLAEANIQDAMVTLEWLANVPGAIADAAKSAWNTGVVLAWTTAGLAALIGLAALAKAVR